MLINHICTSDNIPTQPWTSVLYNRDDSDTVLHQLIIMDFASCNTIFVALSANSSSSFYWLDRTLWVWFKTSLTTHRKQSNDFIYVQILKDVA
jgi:hypothetical protein